MQSEYSTNRCWCFTLNNPTEDEEIMMEGLFLQKKNKITYIVFGREVGEKDKTPHLQGSKNVVFPLSLTLGFIQFDIRRQFGAVKKLLGDRCHIEAKRPQSTVLQAALYCKKGEQSKREWKKEKENGRHFGRNADVFERGVLDETYQGQGKRNDLLSAKAAVEEGTSILDMFKADEYASVCARYPKYLSTLETACVKPRDFKTKVVVFWGDSNTYKSHALSKFKNPYRVVKPSGKSGAVWYGVINFRFDGYKPREHECVLFDEFYGWVTWHSILELTDRYEAIVQGKGTTIQFAPKVIAFTSNSHPERWYSQKNEHMQYATLERRIDCIFHHVRTQAAFDEPYRVEPGQLLIEVELGLAEAHPLFKYMKPWRPNVYVFDEIALRATFEPPKTKQVWLAEFQLSLVDDAGVEHEASISMEIIEDSSSSEYDDDSFVVPDGYISPVY